MDNDSKEMEWCGKASSDASIPCCTVSSREWVRDRIQSGMLHFWVGFD